MDPEAIEATQSEPLLLFWDTFVAADDAFALEDSALGQRMDAIKFQRPVVITKIKVLDQGERDSEDFVGSTNPSKFELRLFAKNLLAQDPSRFNLLSADTSSSSFSYCSRETTVVSTKTDIVTEHIVLGGKYRALSVCVYGFIAEVEATLVEPDDPCLPFNLLDSLTSLPSAPLDCDFSVFQHPPHPHDGQGVANTLDQMELLRSRLFSLPTIDWSIFDESLLDSFVACKSTLVMLAADDDALEPLGNFVMQLIEEGTPWMILLPRKVSPLRLLRATFALLDGAFQADTVQPLACQFLTNRDFYRCMLDLVLGDPDEWRRALFVDILRVLRTAITSDRGAMATFLALDGPACLVEALLGDEASPHVSITHHVASLVADCNLFLHISSFSSTSSDESPQSRVDSLASLAESLLHSSESDDDPYDNNDETPDSGASWLPHGVHVRDTARRYAAQAPPIRLYGNLAWRGHLQWLVDCRTLACLSQFLKTECPPELRARVYALTSRIVIALLATRNGMRVFTSDPSATMLLHAALLNMMSTDDDNDDETGEYADSETGDTHSGLQAPLLMRRPLSQWIACRLDTACPPDQLAALLRCHIVVAAELHAACQAHEQYTERLCNVTRVLSLPTAAGAVVAAVAQSLPLAEWLIEAACSGDPSSNGDDHLQSTLSVVARELLSTVVCRLEASALVRSWPVALRRHVIDFAQSLPQYALVNMTTKTPSSSSAMAKEDEDVVDERHLDDVQGMYHVVLAGRWIDAIECLRVRPTGVIDTATTTTVTAETLVDRLRDALGMVLQQREIMTPQVALTIEEMLRPRWWTSVAPLVDLTLVMRMTNVLRSIATAIEDMVLTGEPAEQLLEQVAVPIVRLLEQTLAPIVANGNSPRGQLCRIVPVLTQLYRSVEMQPLFSWRALGQTVPTTGFMSSALLLRRTVVSLLGLFVAGDIVAIRGGAKTSEPDVPSSASNLASSSSTDLNASIDATVMGNAMSVAGEGVEGEAAGAAGSLCSSAAVVVIDDAAAPAAAANDDLNHDDLDGILDRSTMAMEIDQAMERAETGAGEGEDEEEEEEEEEEGDEGFGEDEATMDASQATMTTMGEDEAEKKKSEETQKMKKKKKKQQKTSVARRGRLGSSSTAASGATTATAAVSISVGGASSSTALTGSTMPVAYRAIDTLKHKKEWEKNTIEVILSEMEDVPRNVVPSLSLLSDLLPLPLPLPNLAYEEACDDRLVWPRRPEQWCQADADDNDDTDVWLARALVHASEDWRDDMATLLEPLMFVFEKMITNVMRTCSEQANIALRRVCAQLVDLSPALAKRTVTPFVAMTARVMPHKTSFNRLKVCRVLHVLTGIVRVPTGAAAVLAARDLFVSELASLVEGAVTRADVDDGAVRCALDLLRVFLEMRVRNDDENKPGGGGETTTTMEEEKDKEVVVEEEEELVFLLRDDCAPFVCHKVLVYLHIPRLGRTLPWGNVSGSLQLLVSCLQLGRVTAEQVLCQLLPKTADDEKYGPVYMVLQRLSAQPASGALSDTWRLPLDRAPGGTLTEAERARDLKVEQSRRRVALRWLLELLQCFLESQEDLMHVASPSSSTGCVSTVRLGVAAVRTLVRWSQSGLTDRQQHLSVVVREVFSAGEAREYESLIESISQGGAWSRNDHRVHRALVGARSLSSSDGTASSVVSQFRLVEVSTRTLDQVYRSRTVMDMDDEVGVLAVRGGEAMDANELLVDEGNEFAIKISRPAMCEDFVTSDEAKEQLEAHVRMLRERNTRKKEKEEEKERERDRDRDRMSRKRPSESDAVRDRKKPAWASLTTKRRSTGTHLDEFNAKSGAGGGSSSSGGGGERSRERWSESGGGGGRDSRDGSRRW